MSDAAPSSFAQTLHWLAAHAGFPASRLPDKAELLVLISAAADHEERVAAAAVTTNVKAVAGRDFAAQLRNYTAQRRRVHYKCDNSAKV